MRVHLRRLACALSVLLAASGCDGKLTGKTAGNPPGGGTPETPEVPTTPWEPVAPRVYLTKVKNLLTGVPPTPAELAAVTADPSALKGMVDGWVASPEGQATAADAARLQELAPVRRMIFTVDDYAM